MCIRDSLYMYQIIKAIKVNFKSVVVVQSTTAPTDAPLTATVRSDKTVPGILKPAGELHAQLTSFVTLCQRQAKCYIRATYISTISIHTKYEIMIIGKIKL